jgi:FMN phosphatase YigB (HAD superfamily)
MAINLCSKEIDAIVFDLEGTLYDKRQNEAIFAEARLQIARHLLTSQGIDGTLATNEVVVGMRDKYLARVRTSGWCPAFVELGGDEAEYHRITRGIDRSAGLKDNPDLAEMLRALRPQVLLGGLTTAPESIADSIGRKILGDGWKNLFDVFVCEDTPGLPAEKPDPRAFQFVLNLLEVPADRAAMIGDSPADDILPAAVLGMMTIYVGEEDNIGNLRIFRIEDLQALID